MNGNSQNCKTSLAYKPKILLIEDDMTASQMIYEYLMSNSFDVKAVETATEAISFLNNDRFDLIILDLNLPDYDGFEVLKALKGMITTPTLVVSAYSHTSYKLTAFKLGAYDYIAKPVDLEELEARIWVHLRHSSSLNLKAARPLTEGNRFNVIDGTVTMDGEPIPLTGIEYEIFSYLYKNRNKVVSRDTLVSILSSQITERSLDNHIKNIRKKIGDDGRKKIYLKTVYGTGYMLKD